MCVPTKQHSLSGVVRERGPERENVSTCVMEEELVPRTLSPVQSPPRSSVLRQGPAALYSGVVYSYWSASPCVLGPIYKSEREHIIQTYW